MSNGDFWFMYQQHTHKGQIIEKHLKKRVWDFEYLVRFLMYLISDMQKHNNKAWDFL